MPDVLNCYKSSGINCQQCSDCPVREACLLPEQGITRRRFRPTFDITGPHRARARRYVRSYLLWLAATVLSLAAVIACVFFTLGAVLRSNGVI